MSSKATILVVEDNELNMKMAHDLLELAGFDILHAPDAETGIELAKSHQPDLVLMDMHMPVCDGYQATRILQADPETRAIPIVAFTALAMEDEQKKAIQCGCRGVICKPINVDTFAQTVEAYLEHSQADAPPGQSLARPMRKLGFAGMAQPGAQIANLPELGSIAEDDREDFICRVSHDLQSPLRKIRQFSGFLKDSAKAELSEDNYLMLQALDRAAGQMNDLLADLLLLSRIGRLEGSMSEFSLLSVINAACKKNQATIDEKQASVELGAMLTLEGNYEQLVQLFYQMIQNSLKYCAKGIVPHIRISCRKATGECAEITIQDNGLGFKAEYADHIFQPLQRLHGVSTYPGTGVGLAIVKKIVERHRGTIRVESALEQGATFTICLPLKQEQASLTESLCYC